MLSGLNMIFHSYHESKNASLIFKSIVLLNSSHEAYGIDLNIFDSTLIGYKLKFQGGQNRKSHKNALACSNSNLNGNSEEDVMSIMISNSEAKFENVLVSNANQSVSVIKITNHSSLILNNSQFTINSILHQNKTALITMDQSHLKVESCLFQNNSGQNGGVLYVTSQSNVQIFESNFSGNSATSNGGVIFAESYVDSLIKDCSFSKNTAEIHAGVIFSTKNTSFQIFRSRFFGNRAAYGFGGCFGLPHYNRYTIESCTFVSNSVGWRGTVMSAEYNTIVHFRNTEFLDNISELRSGVFEVWYSATVTFEKCKFIGNWASFSRSTLSAYNDVKLNIKGCLFENNTSQMVGLMEAENSVSVTLTNSIFTGNSAVEKSLISMGFETNFSVHSCLFYNNPNSSILYSSGRPFSKFTNCTFFDHTLVGDSIFVMSTGDLLLRNNTFYNNVNSYDASIVYADYQSVIHVVSCEFVHNQALLGGVFFVQTDSNLTVEKSTFVNNSASNGGIAHVYNSTIVFSEIEVTNTISKGFGGVLRGRSSNIKVRSSSFYSNKAVYGGCFFLLYDTSLAVYDSIFENNYAREGGAIRKIGPANVSLDNCTLKNNEGTYGGAIYYYNSDYLRISKGSCYYDFEPLRNCIAFHCDKEQNTKCKLYTDDFIISNGIENISSKSNENFFQDAMDYGMIARNTPGSGWLETHFASCKYFWQQNHLKVIQDRFLVHNWSNSHTAIALALDLLVL